LRFEIDKTLIKKATGGDAKAFGEIYFALRGAIYGFGYRMLNDCELAEDVTQEVFIFFIEHPEKYVESRGELLPFLCGVARNRIFHLLRKEKLQFEAFQDDLEDFPEIKDEIFSNPLTLLLDEELAEKVESGIAELPPLQREIFILREIESLSYQEIAEITETPIDSLKSRLYRARRTLAKGLKPYLNCQEEKKYEVC
jgi:RNA polymerase sigma-70 factor, ECF subfamily